MNIKQNEKKHKIIVCIVLLILCLSLCSCSIITNEVLKLLVLEQLAPLNGDWHYDFSNGYSISRVNCKNISLFYRENSSMEYILSDDKFIQEFCYNDNYIFLKCITISKADRINIEDYNILYGDNFITTYIVFDVNAGKILEECDTIEELVNNTTYNYSENLSWTTTSTKPAGASWW